MDTIICPICGKETVKDATAWTRDCHGIYYRRVCYPTCWKRAMAKGYDGEHYTEADECIDDDY